MVVVPVSSVKMMGWPVWTIVKRVLGIVYTPQEVSAGNIVYHSALMFRARRRAGHRVNLELELIGHDLLIVQPDMHRVEAWLGE